MPYAVLLVKSLELLGTAVYAVKQLPEFIASALSLESPGSSDGKLVPEDIVVIPFLNPNTNNGKDFELIVFAHDYPERSKNAEEREMQIQKGLNHLLCQNVCDVTVGICLILVPMLYLEFKIK